jgi:hypothetical protein
MCDLEFDIPRELEDHMHTHDTVDNTNSQNWVIVSIMLF